MSESPGSSSLEDSWTKRYTTIKQDTLDGPGRIDDTATARWNTPLTVAAFGVLCLIWGLSFVVFHVGLQQAPALAFTTVRTIISGGAFALLLLAARHPFPRDRSTHITALTLGATNVVMFWGFQSLALLRISAGEVAILIYVQPLLVALGAWLFLDEKLSPGKILGLALGFAGVAAIVGGQIQLANRSGWIGFACALGAALGWAIGTVYFKSRPHGQSVFWIIALQSLYGILPLVALMLVFEHRPFPVTFTTIWTVLYAGLGVSTVAYILWFSLLRQRAANQVAAFVFLVPFIAVIADALFLGDRFGLGALIGGLCIVVGIWLVNRAPPTAACNN